MFFSVVRSSYSFLAMKPEKKKKKRGFKILTQIFIPNVLLNHMQVLPVPDPGHSENNAGNSIFH